MHYLLPWWEVISMLMDYLQVVVNGIVQKVHPSSWLQINEVVRKDHPS